MATITVGTAHKTCVSSSWQRLRRVAAKCCASPRSRVALPQRAMAISAESKRCLGQGAHRRDCGPHGGHSHAEQGRALARAADESPQSGHFVQGGAVAMVSACVPGGRLSIIDTVRGHGLTVGARASLGGAASALAETGGGGEVGHSPHNRLDRNQ